MDDEHGFSTPDDELDPLVSPSLGGDDSDAFGEEDNEDELPEGMHIEGEEEDISEKDGF